MRFDKWPGKWACGALLPLLVLGGLEYAARSGLLNPVFAPPPSTVILQAIELVRSGRFLDPLKHTVLLLFAGYAIGCVAAIAIGLAMGSSRAVFNLLEPLTEMLRPIPKPALLPPLILFLGLGATMELTIVILGVFFPVLINTMQGVRSVDPTTIDTARTFGRSRLDVWRFILLPASAPFTLAGMRNRAGLRAGPGGDCRNGGSQRRIG